MYNVENAQIKYIDFGLATTREKFIKSSSQDDNGFGRSWYNFPTESECINISDFKRRGVCRTYKNQLTYEEFINKVADTFDGYSLSLCLMELFELLYPVRYIDVDFVEECLNLFREYQAPLMERKSDYVKLHDDYKNLLIQYNLYSVKEPTPSPEVVKLSEEFSAVKLASVREKSKESLFGQTRENPCPPGKIRNPVTGRCNKIKDGNNKNNKKTKTKKVKTPIGEKPCPPGKYRHPVTHRCRNI